jgi:hypothetical protein
MIRRDGLHQPEDGAKFTRRVRMLRWDLIAGWSRSPRRAEMDRRLEMSWVCPDCHARNASIIAPDAEAGKIVDVNCQGCGTLHEASVFFPPTQVGAPVTVGVVWL